MLDDNEGKNKNSANSSHDSLTQLSHIIYLNADISPNTSTAKLATLSAQHAYKASAKTRNNKLHHPLIATSPTQRQGNYFEQLACEYLQQQGLQLIAKNWHQPKVGELDLVMLEMGLAWSTLVFIEVRQRQCSSFGDAAISVTASKQRKIIKAAQYFLQQHAEYDDYECRFDVIAYNINKADIIQTKLENDSSKPAGHSMIKPSITNLSHQPEWLVGAFVAQAW